MLRGLENKTDEEQLWSLGWLSVERRRLMGGLMQRGRY